MKKMTAMLMAVLLLVSISTTAVAADTKTTEISMTIDPSMESYTLTIPATVTIDPSVGTGKLDVTLSDVNLVWNNRLSIRATTKNYVEGEEGSYLVNTSDETKKIPYTLYTEATNGEYYGGQYIEVATYRKSWIENAYREHYENGAITLTVASGDYPGAGTYTDTLTFSVYTALDVTALDPDHPMYPEDL